jgi:hypothetical protein
MTAAQELPIPTQYLSAHDRQKIPPDYQFGSSIEMPLPSPTAAVMLNVEAATSNHSVPKSFDPATHITFTPPDNVLLMTDLGYEEDTGISPIAVSNPFQLFSQDAVEQMRAEILSPEVMKECGYKSNIAASQMRGYCPK